MPPSPNFRTGAPPGATPPPDGPRAPLRAAPQAHATTPPGVAGVHDNNLVGATIGAALGEVLSTMGSATTRDPHFLHRTNVLVLPLVIHDPRAQNMSYDTNATEQRKATA